jgi:hypothetical protein
VEIDGEGKFECPSCHARFEYKLLSAEEMKDIKEGPIRHESLPPELLSKIGTIYKIVGHYVDDSLEKFELGFMRDLHPESEVSIWSRIALAYIKFHRTHPMGTRQEESLVVAKLTGISTEMRIPGDDVLRECYDNPTED